MNNKTKKQLYQDEEDADLDYYDPAEDGKDDRQYHEMAFNQQGLSKRKNDYFLHSDRYQGKVQQPEDEEDQEQLAAGNQSFEYDEVDEDKDGFRQALTQIKEQRKQKSRLLEEDLKAIDEEDREQLAVMRKDQGHQGNPMALRHQLAQFTKLAQIRYYSQKNLQELKRYPTKHFPVSQELNQAEKMAEKYVVSGLSALLQNHQILARKIFYPEEDQHSFALRKPDEDFSSDPREKYKQMWKQYSQQTKDLNEKIEKEIINWSQRTTLLKNSSHNKSHYNSLLMQTPIGQANKVIKDWDRVSKKCQQKRGPLRILFEGEENLHETHDPQIYDDLDLMQQVQKIYEGEIEKEDKQFLTENTMKYLERRNGSEKIKKDVDRRASKNRKIRYNVHPKLLNFLPCQLENLLEARDQIVENLFSRGAQRQAAEPEYIDM